MEMVKKYYKERVAGGRDLFIVAECSKEELEQEDDPIFIIKKSIDTFAEKNSGINHGYSGQGPRVLAELIAEDLCGCLLPYSKEHKHIVKSILDFIKQYDKESKFEVLSTTIEKVIKRGQIETYKFQQYDELFINIMKFIDENIHDNTKNLLTLFRVYMPYSIIIGEDCVCFQNRDYENLGSLNGTTMDTVFKSTVITNMTTETVDYVTEHVQRYDMCKKGKMIYLYDDSCTPWDSKIFLKDYLARFNDIVGKLTNNEYYPITVDATSNNMPSAEGAWNKLIR